MLFRSVYVYICLIMCTGLKAQSDCKVDIQVKVKELDDAHILPYAVVYDMLNKQSYVCDENGVTSLKAPCQQSIQFKIKATGFNDTILSLNLSDQNIILEIGLEHISKHLHDIEIISNREEYIINQGNEHIHEKQIFESSGQSLGKVLENVEGIVAATAGNGNSKPILHGMDGYRVLLLNNEIRQEGQQWGKDHAPEMDAYLAKEIIVLKGASSLRYGSDAMAGVILIQPESIEKTKLKASVLSAFQGNGRAYHISSSVQNSIGFKQVPISWRLQSSYKRSGNISTPERYLKNTGFEEVSGSATIFASNKHFSTELFSSLFHSQLGLYSGAFISNRTDLQSFLETGKVQAFDLSDFSYDIDRPKQKVSHFLLKNKWHIHTGHHSSLDIVLGYQNNRRLEFDRFKPRANNPEFDYRIQTITADANFQWQSNRRFTSLIGANYIYQRNFYSGRFFIPAFYSHTTGFFAIERYRLKKVLLEGGLRYDYKNITSQFYRQRQFLEPVNTFQNFTYSLSAKWMLDSIQTFILNTGLGWRAPSVTELYSAGIHQGSSTFEIGSADLTSERVYSINADYKTNFKKWKASLNAYYQYIPNYIYLSPDLNNAIEVTSSGSWLRYQYQQVNASIYGLDANLFYDFSNFWRTGVSGSFIQGYNWDKKNYLINIPATRLIPNMHFYPYFKSTWQHDIALELKCVFEQHFTDLREEVVRPPEGYQILGFSYTLSKTFHKNTLLFGFNVDNALNTKYRDYTDRFRFYADMPGRNIYINIKYIFN
jgi:iron complex outermembrane recepter protein